MSKEKNMDKCRRFYEEYGAPMIKERFPEYESKIAVGLVGEGSDCFGYDDEVSMDHDYGIGFCMWLTNKDYEKIGNELQAAYDELIKEHGFESEGEFLKRRRGVFTINNFYNCMLQTNNNYEETFIMDYMVIEEYNIATAVNGQVFRDDLGIFTKARQFILEYYPRDVWRVKLARSVSDFSQYAQINYPRMMARADYVAAAMCKNKAIEAAIDAAYLINQIYAPYYKWKRRGMNNFEKLKGMAALLDELVLLGDQSKAWEGIKYEPKIINTKDECVALFEAIAKLILQELNNLVLVNGTNTFLESYYGDLISGKNSVIIEKIIQLELEQYKDIPVSKDSEIFSVMRKSQYMTWNKELLRSYYNDLVEAIEAGRNVILEKHARILRDCNSPKYNELNVVLSEISNERLAIQTEIVESQLRWAREFGDNYPKVAGRIKTINAVENVLPIEAYERYIKSELATYSDKTFFLYGLYIASLTKSGRNLVYEIMSNIMRANGYDSVEDAEEKMRD